MPKNLSKIAFRVATVVLGTWIVFSLIARLRGEILWFQEVDYLNTLVKRWQTQFFLWTFTGSTSIFFLLRNLHIANDLAWTWSPKDKSEIDRSYTTLPKHEEIALEQKKLTISSPRSVVKTATSNVYTARSCSIDSRFPALDLPLLLPLILISCFLIALLFFNYSKIALSTLTPDFSLPNVTPVLPSRWQFFSVQELLVSWVDDIWQLGCLGAIVLFLLIKPRICLNAIAVILSLVFAGVMAGNWAVFVQYLQSNTFGYTDPQFGKDIGFYVFSLPFWQLIDFWLSGLSTCAFISCLLLYLLSGNSLSEGKFPGFSSLQLRHLTFLASTVMISLGIRHWLNRYDLLFSERGVTYGASFTDVNIQLPWETFLNITAIGMAVFLLYRGVTDYRRRKYKPEKLIKIPLLLVFFLVYVLILPLSNLSSVVVQNLIVQPNELAKERPYIERSIAMTRTAFGLEEIDVENFDPQGQLTATDIVNNDLTIDNIRLWDTRPILQTNRQLQQIRLYYKFPDADIDRYLLKENKSASNKSKQQVIIAPRELDYTAVPERAKTWVNEHLIYTHGYGFTLSPVDEVDEGGLPYYFVKDIGTAADEQATLSLSTELDRDSIPIGKPRIYFGELTDNYIMTSTKVQELDYPSGDENVYNVYDGSGGIKIGNFARRILFAEYLKDWQMLFTQNFTPETKLIFRRNINRRIRTIAPFLRFDRDPYLVVAETNNPEEVKQDDNNLYWIIDAYTTSDSYPYSDPGENNFNYIRNSVKIVVDAYNGNVDFYIADPDDPIVQTWDKIFPRLFKPITEMPPSLRAHIRYPEDLFSTQSERLLAYHMTDSQVFYNREDQWEIPEEIYGTELQQVQPYYLIIKLPQVGAEEEEFILLHPYTPTSRPNLIAWLAARSDAQNYGKLLLYTFPKQKLVYGPNQVEALINQDPVISQQISLWNREGSQAIQGNLLIIPIEQSLLYVEPLYLEAERNSLPILARVIVVYENRIVMAETLQEALDAIFTEEDDSAPAIIRPVDELAPAIEENGA